MAAHPILIVGDGVIEIPEELQRDPRYQRGARLQLVPMEPQSSSAETTSDWRKLEGLLAGLPFNATEWKRQERELELTHDERKSGIARPEW